MAITRILATACLAGFFGWTIYKYYNYRYIKGQKPGHRKKGQQTPLQLKRSGNDLYMKGNHQEAIEYYSQAIELCKNDSTIKPADLATFYQNRAAAYDVLNKHQECIQDCTAAIEHNKHYVKAFVRRAKCYEKMNQYEEAIADATIACVLDQFQNKDTLLLSNRLLKTSSKLKAAKAFETYQPKWPSYSILKNFIGSYCRDPIYSKCPIIKIDDLKRIYKEAEEFLNRYDEIRKAKLSVDSEPTDSDTHKRTPVNGQFVDKVVLSEVGDTILNPDDGKQTNVQEVIPDVVQPAEASNSDTVNDKDVEDEEYYFHLLVIATCRSLRGELVGAEELIERLIQSKNCPASIKSNALIKKATISISALANQETPEIETILDIYAQAIKLDPDNPDVYYHRATTYTLADKLDEAKKDLIKATKLNPKFNAAVAQKHYIEFRLAAREGDPSVLQYHINLLKKAVQDTPDSQDLQKIYADALMDLGEFEQADEIYRKIISKDPQDGILLSHLAMLYCQSKNSINEALELLKQAIRVDPTSKLPYELLGSIEIQRGRPDESIKLFEQALDCCRNEFEFASVYNELDAAKAQRYAFETLGSQI